MKTTRTHQAGGENHKISQYFKVSKRIFSFFSKNRTTPYNALKGSGLPQTEHLLNDIGLDAQGRPLKKTGRKAG